MRNDYTDYIMHSSKGEERKNHKYKAREWVKGKWQYIYDEKLGGRAKREFENADVQYRNAKTDARAKERYYDKTVRDHNSDAGLVERTEAALRRDESNKKLDKASSERLEKKEKYLDSPMGKLGKTAQDILKTRDKYLDSAMEKLGIAKHNEKKDAEKTAEQRKAREEGMAERERQKTETNNWRAAETRQNDQFRKAKADTRDANAAKREANYGKDAAAKSEAERKQYLETRLKDVGRAREKQENKLDNTIKEYTDEYVKALMGEDNNMESSTVKLAGDALRLAHCKALESIYQNDVKNASMYGNANSSSYTNFDKNDYLDKLEKEYHKLMG